MTPQALMWRTVYFIECNLGPGMSTIDIKFERYGDNPVDESAFPAIIKELLISLLETIEILVGSPPQSAIAGKIIPVTRVNDENWDFHVPIMGLRFGLSEWNAIQCELIIRNHVCRTIDFGFIDVLVQPSRIEPGHEFDYHPPIHGDEQQHRLSLLRDALSKPLGKIGAMCIGEDDGELYLEDPVWDEDVMGGTPAYEMKGMLRG